AEPVRRVTPAEDYSAAPPPPVIVTPSGALPAGSTGSAPGSAMLGEGDPYGGRIHRKLGSANGSMAGALGAGAGSGAAAVGAARARPPEPMALPPALPAPAALPPGPAAARPTAPSGPAPEPPGDVLDTHLVIAADGREVYEVYQRPEPALL
ncbi:MAG: hypothetical protein ACRD29_20770, partial [Acidimicrobiales bacterium]